jgi:FkbM family methyltransferase
LASIKQIAKSLRIVLSSLIYVTGRATHSHSLNQLALKVDGNNAYALAIKGLTNNPLYSQIAMATRLSAELSEDQTLALKRVLPNAEGQLLQDVFCIICLGEKRDGYFVEVGVGGGKSISNTYMLEKEFGWKGVLVEPNISSHESIRFHRTAHLETRAAASKSGIMLEFQEVVGNGEHSRIANTGGHKFEKSSFKSYQVETITMNEILEKQGAPKEIDFLSLDTEGSELDILAGIDFKKYTFKVMSIEHNFDQQVLCKLDSILIPLGYRRVLKEVSSFDAWYLHSSCKTAFNS